MLYTVKLADETVRRKEGLDPEYEPVNNPEESICTKPRHKEELIKQELASDYQEERQRDSPIPEYQQEEQQYSSPAEEEENGDNVSDEETEEDNDNIPSDTTERPHREYKDDTPASQQLLSESHEETPEPETDDREEPEPTITLQHQPQIPEKDNRSPTPKTPEKDNRPPTPKAPKTTKKQLSPIEELAQHYELTEDLKDHITFYPLTVQQDLVLYYRNKGFPESDTKEFLRESKNIFQQY